MKTLDDPPLTLVELVHLIHQENINMAERLSALEDHVEMIIERFNEHIENNRS